MWPAVTGKRIRWATLWALPWSASTLGAVMLALGTSRLAMLAWMPVPSAATVTSSSRCAGSHDLPTWRVSTGVPFATFVSAVPSISSVTVAVPDHCGRSVSRTSPTCSSARLVSTW